MLQHSKIEALKKNIHRNENLFCYVIRICNLVQEFNGLVSKGSAAMLDLLLCTNSSSGRQKTHKPILSNRANLS